MTVTEVAAVTIPCAMDPEWQVAFPVVLKGAEAIMYLLYPRRHRQMIRIRKTTRAKRTTRAPKNRLQNRV
jgi:sensor domain CHASE-containing protein